MTPQAARSVLVAGLLFALAGLGFGVYGWTQAGQSRGAAPAGKTVGGAESLQAAFVAVADRVLMQQNAVNGPLRPDPDRLV